MSCRHLQQRTRLEFSRLATDKVVEVMGCGLHLECTEQDHGIAARLLDGPPPDPASCDHRGNEVRQADGTCCSDGAIPVFACSVFGECAIQHPAPGLPHVCIRCLRHSGRERPVRVCAICPDRTDAAD
jgi:hypothetical protein